MTRDTILSILAQQQPRLQSLGVKHAALFGSTARGAAAEDSDIDILVDVDETMNIGVYEYVCIVQFLETLFPAKVDVANRKALKPDLKPSIERDAIYAF